MTIKEICKYDRKTPCSIADRLVECWCCPLNPEVIYRANLQEQAAKKTEKAPQLLKPKQAAKEVKKPMLKKPAEPKRIDYEKVRELYDAGMTDVAISEKVGCSVYVVAHWRLKNDLPALTKHISAQQWSEAMKLYKSGHSDCYIADSIGCSLSSIRRWRRNNGLAGHGRKGK